MPADTAPPELWRRLALDPPCAMGPRPASGIVRADPSDFLVEERLGFEADGGAAHLLLHVEKTDANTLFVARELAKRAGCAPADVGFAGLKDRRAVARQWFSVPATPAARAIAGTEGAGFRVLSADSHSRKLRRGALASNRFSICVRDVEGDAVALEERAARIGAAGVPNYFGRQRFGIGGANLERVRDWIDRGRLPRGREARAFLLSAARSLCFNTVLGERVTAGSWNRILAGEIVSLAGSRSVFAAVHADAELATRLAAGDISPTGAMCGAEGMQPTGEAGEVERAALAHVAEVADRLAAAGLRGERRPLVLRPVAFACAREGGELRLEFELPSGGFATSVLRELIDSTAPGGVAE
jgi:tRNA pseudouridine13 synthase